MSRAFAFAGVCLAGGCGVLITYATLRPELARLQAERRGEFVKPHEEEDDRALSRAIANDLNEARQQLKPTPKKGFAWGIREAIWGKPEEQEIAAGATVRVRTRNQQDMAKSPQEVIEKVSAENERG